MIEPIRKNVVIKVDIKSCKELLLYKQVSTILRASIHGVSIAINSKPLPLLEYVKKHDERVMVTTLLAMVSFHQENCGRIGHRRIHYLKSIL